MSRKKSGKKLAVFRFSKTVRDAIKAIAKHRKQSGIRKLTKTKIVEDAVLTQAATLIPGFTLPADVIPTVATVAALAPAPAIAECVSSANV